MCRLRLPQKLPFQSSASLLRFKLVQQRLRLPRVLMLLGKVGQPNQRTQRHLSRRQFRCHLLQHLRKKLFWLRFRTGWRSRAARPRSAELAAGRTQLPTRRKLRYPRSALFEKSRTRYLSRGVIRKRVCVRLSLINYLFAARSRTGLLLAREVTLQKCNAMIIEQIGSI